MGNDHDLLEKKIIIPHTPKQQKPVKVNYKGTVCPSCGNKLCLDAEEAEYLMLLPDYCSMCGQFIEIQTKYHLVTASEDRER